MAPNGLSNGVNGSNGTSLTNGHHHSTAHKFIVGTFDTSFLFTLSFDAAKSELKLLHTSKAVGPHSWLALSEDKSKLYATSWTTPPGLASYTISSSSSASSSSDSGPACTLINEVRTQSRSGYVCVSPVAAYSAGGATGEVFALDPATGGFAPAAQGEGDGAIQLLDFVDRSAGKQRDDGSVLDFGGLRHGAHSADLSEDGKWLYVADIGRNAIFVFSVDGEKQGRVRLTEKKISPREGDGPRHAWPHPNGKVVYVLQEHTSMVDAFELDQDSGTLKHTQGVKIIPEELSPTLFWADEVRLSPSLSFLYASTRGLTPATKGWLAAFPLNTSTGELLASDAILFETRTSGGWANAIQPAPTSLCSLSADGKEGRDYLALTDSEKGTVSVVSFDGKQWREEALLDLPEGAGAATAVWL